MMENAAIIRVYVDGKRHSLYATYTNMKMRCYNPKNPKFKNYGGRGINVCDRWLGHNGFSNFVFDMKEKPSPLHTLDRKRVNEGYHPDNCRWATAHEQMSNMTTNNEIVGAYFDKLTNSWRSWLQVDGKKYSKRFPTQRQAADHRKELEKLHLNKQL